MGPLAFGAERDRLLRSRGRGAWTPGAVGPNGNGNGGVPVAAPAPAEPATVRPRGAVSVMPAPTTTAIPVDPEPVVPTPLADPSEETPAPADAVPLSATPTEAGVIRIGFEEGIGTERLLPAIESVTQAVRDRPGELPVVITIPVAGATREVRLPHRAEWNDRLAESVRQAAGVPVAIELRAESVEG
jgi:hypothetical protein